MGPQRTTAQVNVRDAFPISILEERMSMFGRFPGLIQWLDVDRVKRRMQEVGLESLTEVWTPPIPTDSPEAAALGAEPAEVLGSRDAVVMFDSTEAVRELTPDMRLVEELDCYAVCVTGPGSGPDRDVDFVSRFFAPALGIPEDPVTGSAHCSLVPHWAGRLGKTRLRARQVSPRGGELWCEHRGARAPRVGGVHDGGVHVAEVHGRERRAGVVGAHQAGLEALEEASLREPRASVVSHRHAAVGNRDAAQRGVEQAVVGIIEQLKKISKNVKDRVEISQVATISANGDEAIGEIIADAMDKVGKDGTITVEEAKAMETTLEVVEGMQFDRGYLSPYFVTDAERMEAVLEDTYVLIHEKKISSMKDLLPLLEQVAKIG